MVAWTWAITTIKDTQASLLSFTQLFVEEMVSEGNSRKNRHIGQKHRHKAHSIFLIFLGIFRHRNFGLLVYCTSFRCPRLNVELILVDGSSAGSLLKKYEIIDKILLRTVRNKLTLDSSVTL